MQVALRVEGPIPVIEGDAQRIAPGRAGTMAP